jgi:transcriptional regulator with XRE-family HTH domain
MDNVLGKRLRQLREKKAMNQREFSKIINISNTTLSQYEAGNRTPSDEIKEKIADYFSVSVDYLLGRTDSSFYDGQTLYDASKIVDVSGLPEEDAKKVEEYADLLKLKLKFNADGTPKT